MALFAEGEQHDVPILIGSNENEGSLFAQGVHVGDYKDWVRRMCYDSAGDLLALFPASTPEEVGPAFDRLYSVMAFTYPARLVARSMAAKRSKAFLYHFSRVPSHSNHADKGAYHGIEIPYVFGHLRKEEGGDEVDRELSTVIKRYWTSFAACGDPNAAGLPEWPPYEEESDLHMEFGDTIEVGSGLHRRECDALYIAYSQRPLSG